MSKPGDLYKGYSALASLMNQYHHKQRDDLESEVEALREREAQSLDELAELRAQVRAVRDVHRCCITVPVQDGGCTPDEHDADAGDPPICLHDAQNWPCTTIRALDGGDA